MRGWVKVLVLVLVLRCRILGLGGEGLMSILYLEDWSLFGFLLPWLFFFCAYVSTWEFSVHSYGSCYRT